MAVSLQPRRRVSGKTRSPRAGSAPLVRDERGAIMVIGVFMAVMLVGVLYYVWGIGGAVLFTIRLVLLFIGATSQTASAACALTSLSSGMVTA